MRVKAGFDKFTAPTGGVRPPFGPNTASNQPPEAFEAMPASEQKPSNSRILRVRKSTILQAFLVVTAERRLGKRARQISHTRPSHPLAVQNSLP